MNSSEVTIRILPGLVKNFLGIPTPLIWAYKVTFKCNCECRFCPCWKMDSDGELDTEDAIDLIHQARRLGVVFVAFEGGEPLLRSDLPILLKESKDLGMVTTVITNGILLKKRLPEILPYTDVIVVSLDGLKNTHTKIRCSDDVFDKAIEGAKEAIPKTKFFFSCVINKENLHEIKDLVLLAKDMGTSIVFCPCADFNDAEKLSVNQRVLQDVMGELVKMREGGYPIVNSLPYLKAVHKGKKFICKTGQVFIHTDPQGNVVMPCYAWKGKIKPFASTRERSLREIWFSDDAKILRKEAENCNTCDFTDCVEVAMLLSGRIDVFMGLFKQFNSI